MTRYICLKPGEANALEAGTMTRLVRPLKQQPTFDPTSVCMDSENTCVMTDWGRTTVNVCPFGRTGDRIGCKEPVAVSMASNPIRTIPASRATKSAIRIWLEVVSVKAEKQGGEWVWVAEVKRL